jgi:hypothetical protein
VPRSIAVEVTAPPVRDTAEIEAAIAKLGRDLGGGLIVAPDGFTTVHQHLFIRLAQQHRLFVAVHESGCGGTQLSRTCATARPQLAKADTAFQAHPLVNRLNLA